MVVKVCDATLPGLSTAQHQELMNEGTPKDLVMFLQEMLTSLLPTRTAPCFPCGLGPVHSQFSAETSPDGKGQAPWSSTPTMLRASDSPSRSPRRHKNWFAPDAARSKIHDGRVIETHVDNDNDNDNDTLRKVPHPSNEGLALQARVKGS